MLLRRKRSGTLTLNWLIRKLFVVKNAHESQARIHPGKKITVRGKFREGLLLFDLKFDFFLIYGFLDG